MAHEWQNCSLNQAVRVTGASLRWPGGVWAVSLVKEEETVRALSGILLLFYF